MYYPHTAVTFAATTAGAAIFSLRRPSHPLRWLVWPLAVTAGVAWSITGLLGRF